MNLAKQLNRIYKAFCVISLVFTQMACVIQPPVQPNDPYYAPILKTVPTPDQARYGSLYRENGNMGLFTDQKASQVGDIITVILQESTTSSKQTNVGITKDDEISISPTLDSGTVLGTNPSMGSFGLSTSLTGEREFTGEAEADQSNSLRGNISVTVVDQYPNGTLVIRGEKWMTLNRGDEYIRISGLIRPDDITPQNTVMSTKIANARITYSGRGDLANSQRQGWLSKFFNSEYWPF